MPKVNEAYRIKKKERILYAAAEVLKNKTLYEISMTDIIKEVGMSKGGIYLYYKDIDELLIDVIDREFKADNFRDKIQSLINGQKPVDTMIVELFRLYALYLEESSALAGKMQFELTILLTQNRERALKIREKVSIRETGSYFNERIVQIIQSSLGDKPEEQEKAGNIINYIRCFLDGILEIYVLEKCYQFSEVHVDLNGLMEMLSKNVIHMLKEASVNKRGGNYVG